MQTHIPGQKIKDVPSSSCILSSAAAEVFQKLFEGDSIIPPILGVIMRCRPGVSNPELRGVDCKSGRVLDRCSFGVSNSPPPPRGVQLVCARGVEKDCACACWRCDLGVAHACCCCAERGVGDIKNIEFNALALLVLLLDAALERAEKDPESELSDSENGWRPPVSAPRARGGTRAVGPEGMFGLLGDGTPFLFSAMPGGSMG